MVGALLMSQCCTPAAQDPPDYPGSPALRVECSVSSYMHCPILLAVATYPGSVAPCWDRGLLICPGPSPGTGTLRDVSASFKATKALSGSVTATFCGLQRTYSWSGHMTSVPTVDNASPSYVATELDWNDPALATEYCGAWPPATAFLQDATWSTAGADSALMTASFGWLVRADRDIHGLSVSLVGAGGGFRWFVRVASGVVTVSTDDGAHSFSCSGTLAQAAAAINASSISGWVSATAWKWSLFSAPAASTAPEARPWRWVLHGGDGCSMLNDQPWSPLQQCGPAYLCAWRRDDVLPPRGCVWIEAGPASSPRFAWMNDEADLGTSWPNTQEGALSFLRARTRVSVEDPDLCWGGPPSATMPAWSGSYSPLPPVDLDGSWTRSTLAPHVQTFVVENPLGPPVSCSGERTVVTGMCCGDDCLGFGGPDAICWDDPSPSFPCLDTPSTCTQSGATIWKTRLVTTYLDEYVTTPPSSATCTVTNLTTWWFQ